jgi:hypothetical protein
VPERPPALLRASVATISWNREPAGHLQYKRKSKQASIEPFIEPSIDPSIEPSIEPSIDPSIEPLNRTFH